MSPHCLAEKDMSPHFSLLIKFLELKKSPDIKFEFFMRRFEFQNLRSLDLLKAREKAVGKKGQKRPMSPHLSRIQDLRTVL